MIWNQTLYMAAILANMAAALSAKPAQMKTLRGHVPAAARQQRSKGRPAPSRELDLAIGLPLRNAQALTNFLADLYDPNSPNFRNYLTPEQFTAQFGPTEQDYQSVIAFAQAQGFTVTATHPNRMLLGVRATVANVERAFGVTLR